jgi:modulator of FtsH protease
MRRPYPGVLCQDSRVDGIDISAWSDFGVAVAGAMAALTGLLFVAISINLERIIALPSLPRLAIATLGLFSTVLVASVCLLIPNQSTDALVTEFLVVGLGFGIPMVVLQLRRPRWTPYTGPVDWVATRLAPAVVVPGCVALAGLGLLLEWTGALHLIAVSTVVAIVAGLVGAWILLVEIQR